ncbi:MAG TPA: hypothetical protein VMN36_16185 [Verrucomicrobiales bacterium]|nr:hypothetical protein [Verrucomicrobiales bacterium]
MNAGFEPNDPEWDFLGKASRPAPRAGFAQAVLRALESQDGSPRIVRFPAAQAWVAGLTAAAAAVALIAIALSTFRSPNSSISPPQFAGSQPQPVAIESPSSPLADELPDEDITGLFTLERLLSTEDVDSLDNEDLVALLY